MYFAFFICHPKSKYNYPDHNDKFKYIERYDSKYLYDHDSFTQISIIDNEIYYTNNIDEVITNVYSWLIHKGLLFIQVYDSENDFMNNMSQSNNENNELSKIVYSQELTKVNKNHYTLIEES